MRSNRSSQTVRLPRSVECRGRAFVTYARTILSLSLSVPRNNESINIQTEARQSPGSIRFIATSARANAVQNARLPGDISISPPPSTPCVYRACTRMHLNCQNYSVGNKSRSLGSYSRERKRPVANIEIFRCEEIRPTRLFFFTCNSRD